MPEHDAWLTALFNRFLAGPANSILQSVHSVFPSFKVEDPAHPWANWLAFELLVFFLIIIVIAVLRSKLSVEKPGTLQHLFEIIYNFVSGEANDNIEHGGGRYLSFFGTLFILHPVIILSG